MYVARYALNKNTAAVTNEQGEVTSAPGGATGTVLTSNGSTLQPTFQGISASGITGVLPIANGGTSTTTSTGTGSVVLQTSPTIITPTLTTPVVNSGTLATPTITGTPVQTSTFFAVTQDSTSGVVGHDTITGTGNIVASTSPTITTPILVTPNVSSLTASQIVTTDGSKNLVSTAVLPILLGGTNLTTYKIPTYQTFTSGTGAYTPTSGTMYFRVTCVGGGGGGGAAAAGAIAGGGGGGGGGVVTATFTNYSLSPGFVAATYAYTVGTAGSGGTTSVAAGNGTSSQFVATSGGTFSLVASPGIGGNLGTTGSAAGTGGSGGIPSTSGSVINTTSVSFAFRGGSTGINGQWGTNLPGGAGGMSPYGGGGGGSVQAGSNPGQNYGGGGGGASGFVTSGSAGAAGVVYIEEYYW